ncbi:MAG: hypothetical protein UX02_C0002G0410 [Candidatus Moranbacteria bacterium GW2011_GWC1_45_18]|nr:MAG: hypothetical protein UT79_C0001G0051 [Candidatus Moranbacteria bacterium GW2011_GWC2_40_12]KKT32685.1 MAG: hypothetical protein UW19_C0017G0023 [Candidatus Moranbacteria bacterium GW2011_GWF2_44_10]KKT71973.1 MAG: hypothetical protein UW66_C0017G0011 [Candidatus Moranbacteria bacterium GW2011_GWF1_44_4]KKU00167.1 MAG: hypothetical protein UX02_C0002G0410 [Candidatus Moranbacteria bacterium GW2011_GWC1_45_18]OGI24079.1 MAG: hypothetical protein A2194_04115 [Candidatus Moranbacteria bacte
MLLLGSARADIWITLFLLSISFIVSLIFFAVARRKILALIVFSVLANISVLLNAGSGMFDFYSIGWLKTFSVLIWPLLNIFFIIRYVQTKPAKPKK